jgi:glycosyltransferase involved in cell wall biosynthesis
MPLLQPLRPSQSEGSALPKLRILFVGIGPPIPTTSGQRIRNRNLLRAIKSEGHEVTLICFGESGGPQPLSPELTEICKRARIVPLPPNGSSTDQFWSRLKALFTWNPHGVGHFQHEAMRSAVEEELTSGPFDLVICDDVYMLSNIPECSGTPVVLNKHDLTFEIFKRFSQIEKNLAKKIYARLECWKVRRLEFLACHRVSAIFACSPRDKEMIQESEPGSTVFVLPNTIDTAKYSSDSQDDGHTILYTGAMDWLPNRDAVAYFIEQIYPLVKKSIPEARFIIAGRNPPKDFCERYSEIGSVSFTGTVSDVGIQIARATVCVVPLRIASGTRLKILEASAAGKAVVSTRVGVEGLDLDAGQDILIADDPQSFAASVIKLLRDPNRRKHLAESARRKVEQLYGIPALQAAVRDAFESLRPALVRSR